jgi:hypothetical protein
MSEPDVGARPGFRRGYLLPTNFYPAYDGANDQVDRITPVARIRFQRVLPRYRLSTSETRDLGLGPALESLATLPIADRRQMRQVKTVNTRPRRTLVDPLRGHRVDLLA